MSQVRQKMPLWLRQLIKYGLFGCICSLVDILIYLLLTGVFDWHPLESNLVSSAIGITLSFFFNRSFTFRVKDNPARRYARFFGVGLLGMAAQELVIWLLFSHVETNSIVAKLIAVVIAGILQFVLNRCFSFREMDDDEDGLEETLQA